MTEAYEEVQKIYLPSSQENAEKEHQQIFQYLQNGVHKATTSVTFKQAFDRSEYLRNSL